MFYVRSCLSQWGSPESRARPSEQSPAQRAEPGPASRAQPREQSPAQRAEPGPESRARPSLYISSIISYQTLRPRLGFSFCLYEALLWSSCFVVTNKAGWLWLKSNPEQRGSTFLLQDTKQTKLGQWGCCQTETWLLPAAAADNSWAQIQNHLRPQTSVI